MTTCTYCGKPGAPKPGVMCSACIDKFQEETAPPPLSDDEVEQFKDFFSRPAERVAIIVADDLVADCPVKPGDREKVMEHYDAIVNALPPGALQIFSCGPSTSPCGPNREDHVWDDEVELTDSAGRVTGCSSACSRCGLTAMDFDIWNAD